MRIAVRVPQCVHECLLVLGAVVCCLGGGDAAASSWDTTTAVAPGTPRLSGYVQFQLAHKQGAPHVADAFTLGTLRVAIKGEVSPRAGYVVEVDPRDSQAGGMLRDAYATLGPGWGQTLRVGQMKPAFGYENLESSTRLYLVRRAEVSSALARGRTSHDIGLGWSGSVPMGTALRIEHVATVVNGAGMNVAADDTPRKNLWARLGVRGVTGSRLSGAHFGISAGTGDRLDHDSGTGDVRRSFERGGVDARLDARRVFLSAELVVGRDRRPDGSESSVASGGYVLLAGKLTPRGGPVVRYDAIHGAFERWTLGAWLGAPTERVRVMLHHEHVPRSGRGPGSDQTLAWLQMRF